MSYFGPMLLTAAPNADSSCETKANFGIFLSSLSDFNDYIKNKDTNTQKMNTDTLTDTYLCHKLMAIFSCKAIEYF